MANTVNTSVNRSLALFTDKSALLLDMNSTFMFGEDRFGDAEDFSVHYFKIGGTRPKDEINRIVRAAYGYLAAKYPDETYHDKFSSVESAICETAGKELARGELEKIVETFAFHELGYIPNDYAEAAFKACAMPSQPICSKRVFT